jgi:25S rRNA (adenine2142-N1)-methyltransferase
MAKKPTARKKLLSSTRPYLPNQPKHLKSLSSKTTSSIIRTHHTLHKQLAQARKAGDAESAAAIERQIESLGGLKLYQAASTVGQSKDRGGDTSRVLVDWLGLDRKPVTASQAKSNAGKQLRILEVGSLSTTNALNIPGLTLVRRIDLHSQSAGIEERDFMSLSPSELWQGKAGYDILSLSLVVNYVSEPKERGEMLQHTVPLLHDAVAATSEERLLPSIFLVLPLPCVDNSRYLTEERLEAIMSSLGYEKRRVKRSSRLYYSLWQFLCSHSHPAARHVFKKQELRSGKTRNNFYITLGEPD